MYKLHKYPFLRLLLALMTGVILGDYLFFCRQSLSVPCIVISLSITIVGMLCSFYLKRYSLRWLFGFFFTLFCLIGGMAWMNLQLQQTVVDFPDEESVYRVVVTEKPQEKARSLFCKVQLISMGGSQSTRTYFDRQPIALLYVAKDSLSRQINTGSELLVSARISPPMNNGNPDEFDYMRYSRRRGVSGTGYVASGYWRQIACRPPATLLSKALASREHILNEYHRLGFEGETFAVLSALTVGYMNELDEGLLESYSVSGASHVLSLSGLHIGFLYGLLFLLLRGIPGKGWVARSVRSLVILLSLWSFAFFTGLSPSVVRSVCMFSLLAFSYLFCRKTFNYNLLFATAFFMLLFCPGWLFDVGFQLSFCAVLAILWVQPVLYRSLRVRTRAGRYVWGLMSVSIAAQLGTAPLVLFYFSRFSTHFLLTNLLVVPLSSIILYAAVVLLVCMPFPFLQFYAAVGVRWLVEGLNGFVRWVEHLPFSSVDHVWMEPLGVAGFYLILLMAMRFLQRCTARRLMACLGVTLLVCLGHTALRLYDRPRQTLRFYNIKECPLVHCIAPDGESWLVYADSLPDKIRLQKVASRHWARLGLFTPQEVYDDNPHSDTTSPHVRNSIVSFGGQRVCILNDNRWQNKTTSHPLSIDYLYLCKGYTGRLEWVTGLFDIRKVILDSSLPEYRRKALKAACCEQGISFVSLPEEGSVGFML